MARRPADEVLAQGDESGRAARRWSEGGLADLFDWWVEHPRRRRRGDFGVGLLLVATLVADVLAVVRHSPPERPTVPPAVLQERQRVAGRVAQFARDRSCPDGAPATYEVVRHDASWSSVRYRVEVAPGTPDAGLLVVDVEPFDTGVRYRLVETSGSCRP